MSRFYIPTEGPESWQALLADPGSQWRTGYSAKALAYSWEAANGQLPREVKTLFGDDAELIIALPEHKVSLGDRGRDSQTDVFAIIKREGQTIAVAVEGKVAEFFGPTIKGWYVEPIAGKEKRLAYLCRLLGLSFPPPPEMPYQLFHRTASALLESDRFKTDQAAMVVHSFSAPNKWFDAYASFIRLFGLEASIGKLVTTRLRTGKLLHFGWVKGDEEFLRI